ncbi:type II toxin-antitoxin system VapC family toxin [soil metagenome]
MNLVLDNSVTMRWFFEDGNLTDLAYADKVLASMTTSNAIVPLTWGLEVANVLARAESKQQIIATEIRTYIEILRGLDIEVDTDTFEHTLSDTLQLARAHNLSSYDASYFELAARMDIPLATLDESLRKAAKRSHVKIFTK